MEFRLDLTRQYNTLDLILELEVVNDKVLIFYNLLKSTLGIHAPSVITVKLKNRPCTYICYK
jgi:hypothetical protein